ncbi:MAG: class I SAM-dependent methyltransferase [Calditerrivibrio sp.]|nr:class I SAM-dependent methyltransferase [Calditerrivibrio sp.]
MVAQNYLFSSDHISGEDLKYVSEFFRGVSFDFMLDLATGAGHFTTVFNSNIKIAFDYSLNMLKTAIKKYDIDLGVKGDVAFLPFREGSFDLVSCRIAMHHFKNIQHFWFEVHRVLKKNGYFVLIDSIVDIDDAYLNCIEYVRDNSHIRSFSVKEIINFSDGKFRLEDFRNFYKKHDIEEWGRRLNPSEYLFQSIKEQFKKLPENIKEELGVEEIDGVIRSYTDKKGLFIFKKIC